MAVVKAVGAEGEKRKRPARALSQALPQTSPVADPIRLGDLSDFLGYSLKRAQLRIFDDFIGCVAPLQLTPAQFSVLMLVDANPDRNQSEIASTLGILRPNFVALLDELEERFLHDVFGRSTPLARVQHQRGRVPVDQSAEQLGVHHPHDAPGSG